MKLRANKMLGVSLGERSMLIAEVIAVGERCQLTHTAEFVYSAQADLEHPDALGKALGELLKSQRFGARAAIFGLPAKWVLTKSKEIPPVDPSMAADLLRMQVEAEFSPELKDLVYDYAGQSSARHGSQVLLAATPNRYVELVRTIAEAARVDVRGITATTTVLGAATTNADVDALTVSITPSATELAAQHGEQPVMLRHVASAAAVTTAVAGEVRRASLLLPDGNAGAKSAKPVVLWDDAGLNPAEIRAFSAALGDVVRPGDFAALGAGEPPAGIRVYASAAGLAVAGILPQALPVDFAHSRLAPPRKSALQRQTLLAIVAGVALIIGCIYAYSDLQRQEGQLRQRKADLAQLEKNRKSAEAEVAMIQFARGWHAENPRFIACVRDLTVAIPEDAKIYITNFNLHESMKGAVSGKAPADKSALTLKNRLEASGRFSEVKLAFDSRDTRGGREVSFSINFKYKPA